MTEEKQQAVEILNNHGAIDGQKHLTQLIYFAENIESKILLRYWKGVNMQFNQIINGKRQME